MSSQPPRTLIEVFPEQATYTLQIPPHCALCYSNEVINDCFVLGRLFNGRKKPHVDFLACRTCFEFVTDRTARISKDSRRNGNPNERR